MEGLTAPDPTTRLDELRTERLVLRRATMADLDAVHAMLSDPKAMRYWSTLPHETREKTADWLSGMVESSADESDDFLIELDGQVIGKLGAWRIPEIGFLLRSEHWGQGYASEALAAFMAYISQRGVARLTADVDPRNAASLRLLTNAGFVETHRAERTWQVGEEWCDSVYLAWEAGS